MSDIVERLRDTHREITEIDSGECPLMALVREAADEIERLRKRSPGPELIASMRDFVQTLERGERLGAHYKMTVRCRACGERAEECTCRVVSQFQSRNFGWFRGADSLRVSSLTRG